MCALLQVPLPTVKAELQAHLVHLKNKVRSGRMATCDLGAHNTRLPPAPP